jgi:hypothetical protein
MFKQTKLRIGAAPSRFGTTAVVRLTDHDGADGGTRTHTPKRAEDFKSSASTGSATSATLKSLDFFQNRSNILPIIRWNGEVSIPKQLKLGIPLKANAAPVIDALAR